MAVVLGERAGASAPARSGALAPFRHRMYRAVWIGTLFSNFGIWVQSVGASWLMLSLAPSPDMVALVQTASSLPMLLFSLLGGALADLWDRRLVFLAGQSVVVAVAGVLAWFDYSGLMTPWLLLAFTFLLGSGAAIRQPAYQATVGDLVPPEEVPAAVAANSVGFNLARSLGPGLGGLIVAVAGVKAAFLFNALSNVFIVSVLVVWMRRAARERRTRERLFGAILLGIRYVARSRPIRAVMIRCFVFTALTSGLWALLPVIAKHEVGGGPVGYGLLLGSLGVGAIVGAASISLLRRWFRTAILIGAATLLFAGATAALSFVHSLWLLMPILFAAGLAWLITLSSFNIMVQLSAEAWVKARALSIYLTSLFAGLALGSWVWGHVAVFIGVPAALEIAAAALAASLVLSFTFKLPSLALLEARRRKPAGAAEEIAAGLIAPDQDRPGGTVAR
jgi:MFS family permease